MSTEPKIKSTNPIMRQILKRYVGADSVGSNLNIAETTSSMASETDWYNMTCPRCPWFVDGERMGQYAMVNDDNNDATAGDIAGDNDVAAGDMAGDSSSAPDNAAVAGKDADGDSGRATGDSGRVGGDDTPWDEEWDELLDGVDAECDESDDIIGLDEPGNVRRVPIVQCVRPESEECLNESFCVRLLVASDLIRQQVALEKMQSEIMGGLAPCVDDAGGSGDVGRKLTKQARRSLKLRRASKKRGQ